MSAFIKYTPAALAGGSSSGGGGSSYTFTDSVVNTAGTVTLVNDSATPGDSKYYGTNSGGTLGYYNLPGGSSLTAPDVQTFVAGTGQTWTAPTNPSPLYCIITAAGPGGGAAGSNGGGASGSDGGGTTTVGSFITCSPGKGGVSQYRGGSGGAISLTTGASVIDMGSCAGGGGGTGGAVSQASMCSGGGNILSGSGAYGTFNVSSNAGFPNTGAGGASVGGSISTGAGGGGAGGVVIAMLKGSIPSTLAISVSSGGAGGAAGSSGYDGGPGSDGVVRIVSYFQ